MPQRVRGRNPNSPARVDKMYEFGRIDPYQPRKKMPDPTRCPRCGSLYIKGRWTWKKTAERVHEELCPACRRIKDRVAAGVVNLSGPFFEEHRKEAINLIRNVEKLEKERHPLERLMKMKGDKALRVETTGMHLARRIGDALENSFQGELKIEYLKGQYKARISWQR